ncbi:MAG: hypothetical protein IPL79_13070 [Myxococcales bacterium]|nr:hypothetical protein [Myxococcales bacterium]
MATTQQHSPVAAQAQGSSVDTSGAAAAQTADPAMSAATELQRLELMQRMPALDFCVFVARLPADQRWDLVSQFEQMGDIKRALLAIAAASLAENEEVLQNIELIDERFAQCLAVDEQPTVATIVFTVPNATEPSRSFRATPLSEGYEIRVYRGSPAQQAEEAAAEDVYEDEQPDIDPASFGPVTGDATTWRVLGPGARAALKLPRAEDDALDASVAELVTTYPDEVEQILTIVRVRMGTRAVEAYKHISDPERLRVPTDLHAISIMTKRIAALDAVIAQESAGPHGGGAKKTPAAFGIVAAAHVERMDLEHSRDILATGKGRYEGAMRDERIYKTWTMQQRKGRAIDCTTFPLKVLADTAEAVGKPGLFNAFKKAMYQVWREKEGAGPNATPTVWDDDVLNGLRVALGWKGFFISRHDSSPADSREWNNVPVDPALALSDFKRDSMSLKRVRELPFAVIGQGGHMGMLVYGKWYEVHWSHSHSDPELIESSDLVNRATDAVAMAPPADVERVLRAPRTPGEE